MKKKFYPLLSFVFLFSSILCSAQLKLTYPSDRAVFQRNKLDTAVIVIGGYLTECVDKVEARFVPIKSNPNKPELGRQAPAGGGWAVIKSTAACGNFHASMPVHAGWYRLEVRGVRNGKEPVVDIIPHVGVGEVFLVAGQSNATGGDANPTGPGATEDAVSSVNFRNQNNDSYSNFQLITPEYVHLDQNTKTAPFGNYAWCWGSFGDKLVAALNVPVMIFNAGWSATGIVNWKESIPTDGVTRAWFGANYPAGLPFGHLRIALNNYIAQLGIRAVLWHQGETDTFVGSSQETYRNSLRSIIQESRNLSGKPDLSWIVSRASRYSWRVTGDQHKSTHVSANVIAAQNDVIGLGAHGSDPDYKLNGVFAGPETDTYWSTSYRSDSVHFVGNGLLFLAQLWVDRINTNFLSSSTPYSAKTPPNIAITQSEITTLNFNAEAGWASYKWLQQSSLPPTNYNQATSTSREWSAGTGWYTLKTIDSQNNAVLSPTLYVSGTVLPVVWKYFNGKASDQLIANLNWATAEEINADFYEVQRSRDAVNFEPVETITAYGDSRSEQTYSYQDNVPSAGTYYYRLRQVDKDGKYDYSRIISLKFETKQTVKIYPNPVSDYLLIQSEGPINSVEIYNVLGIRVAAISEPGNFVKVDVSRYQSGIYTVVVNGESFKILK